jgi:hypothetical protein
VTQEDTTQPHKDWEVPSSPHSFKTQTHNLSLLRAHLDRTPPAMANRRAHADVCKLCVARATRYRPPN